MRFALKDLEKEYNLDLDKVISKIKNSKAKDVLVQFPEGLKPWAVPITRHIEENTSANVKIWLGSCFGACDVPKSDCDLLVQFGHAKWV
jgi:2-(3-amino-3-carboxypropyl)histidine synthase